MGRLPLTTGIFTLRFSAIPPFPPLFFRISRLLYRFSLSNLRNGSYSFINSILKVVMRVVCIFATCTILFAIYSASAQGIQHNSSLDYKHLIAVEKQPRLKQAAKNAIREMEKFSGKYHLDSVVTFAGNSYNEKVITLYDTRQNINSCEYLLFDNGWKKNFRCERAFNTDNNETIAQYWNWDSVIHKYRLDAIDSSFYSLKNLDSSVYWFRSFFWRPLERVNSVYDPSGRQTEMVTRWMDSTGWHTISKMKWVYSTRLDTLLYFLADNEILSNFVRCIYNYDSPGKIQVSIDTASGDSWGPFSRTDCYLNSNKDYDSIVTYSYSGGKYNSNTREVRYYNENKLLTAAENYYFDGKAWVLADDIFGTFSIDGYAFFLMGKSMKLYYHDVSAIRDKEKAAPQFLVCSNYPNPFNPVTTFRYTLPRAADVQIHVYTVQGKEVAVLHQGQQAAGTHESRFNAATLASGMYFYILQAGQKQVNGKLLLLK